MFLLGKRKRKIITEKFHHQKQRASSPSLFSLQLSFRRLPSFSLCEVSPVARSNSACDHQSGSSPGL
ncbi:hypothetical protein ABKV19_008397 [Rosa sericea]